MSKVIHLYVESTINEGKGGQVRELLQAAVAKAKDHEPSIVSYQFYFSEDGSKVYFNEVYRDADGFREHMKGAGEGMAQMMQLISVQKLMVFGDMPSDLAEAFAPMNPVFVKDQIGFTR